MKIYFQKFPKNAKIKTDKNEMIFSKLNTDFNQEEMEETKILNLNSMIIQVNNGTTFKTENNIYKICQIISVYDMIDNYHFNN
jgi:hypothetical protein